MRRVVTAFCDKAAGMLTHSQLLLAGLGIEFGQQEVVGNETSWQALIVSPGSAVVLGAQRLRELRASTEPGEIDRQILQEVRRRDRDLNLIIFRGVSEDGAGSWTLCPDLPADDLAELGYLLTCSQIAVYRAFLAAGIIAIVHVDFERHAVDALQNGANRLADELEDAARGSGLDADLATIDRWLVKNLTFLFGLSFDKAVSSVLPGHLRLLHGGAARMRAALADVSVR